MPGIQKCWSSTCSNNKRVSQNPSISHAPCSRVALNGNRKQVGAQRCSGVLAHCRRCTENTSTQECSRKGFLAGAVSIVSVARELVYPDGATALACQGLRAYELQQCLKEKRAAQEEDDEDDVQGSKLKLKQYEQPGELVTLPSGIQYRELLEGTGSKVIGLGSKVSMKYTVYKLSSGAYFKYSSGGTPVLLYALGYGTEGKNDVGETYTFVMGDKEALPIAATLGMVGMRAGGRRRILVPPTLGWARDEKVGPPRDTFGASRRLANNKDGPLLFEADVTSVRDVGDQGFDLSEYEKVKLRSPYTLPPPPVYGKAS